MILYQVESLYYSIKVNQSVNIYGIQEFIDAKEKEDIELKMKIEIKLN